MSTAGLLILLFGLIVCSAFFSSAEAAFISLSAIRVQHLCETGNKRMLLVRTLRENRERLMITLLIGNNLVNTAAASVATSMAFKLLGSDAKGMSVAVGLTTFIILVFGEITPKNLALAHSEAIASAYAPLIRFLEFVFLPVIWILEVINKFITRSSAKKNLLIITEDEIKTVVNMGEEVGEVEAGEAKMIHNIFRFSELSVSEIMTDRTQIFSLKADRTMREAAGEAAQCGYSRIPVYEINRDHMVGILHVKEILAALLAEKDDALVKEWVKPVMFVPETMQVDDLLREFQQDRIHMALVVDEHGGVSGLVTIEDLLEEIVGEIRDETDLEPDRIRMIGQNKALVAGDTEIEEVNRVLDLGLKEDEDYETISGFVLTHLRHIPEPGEVVCLEGAVIRITKADPQRIIEVEVESLGKASETVPGSQPEEAPAVGDGEDSSG